MKRELYIIRETATFERTFSDRIRYIGGTADYNDAHEKLERMKWSHDITESTVDSFVYTDENAAPIYGSTMLPTAKATVRVSIIAVPII